MFTSECCQISSELCCIVSIPDSMCLWFKTIFTSDNMIIYCNSYAIGVNGRTTGTPKRSISPHKMLHYYILKLIVRVIDTKIDCEQKLNKKAKFSIYQYTFVLPALPLNQCEYAHSKGQSYWLLCSLVVFTLFLMLVHSPSRVLQLLWTFTAQSEKQQDRNSE